MEGKKEKEKCRKERGNEIVKKGKAKEKGDEQKETEKPEKNFVPPLKADPIPAKLINVPASLPRKEKKRPFPKQYSHTQIQTNISLSYPP